MISRCSAPADRTADYMADPEGNALNFRMMSDAVTVYRQCGAVPDDCLEEIRRDTRKRKDRE